MTTTPHEKNARILYYLRAIRHIAGQHAATIGQENYEELESDCMLAVSKAIDKYEPGKGKIDTFVWRYIRRRVDNYMRSFYGTVAGKEREQNIPFTDHFEHGADGIAGPVTDPDTEIFCESIIRLVSNPRRRKVLTLSADGLTFADIGRRMGISRERVRQVHDDAVRDAREKMGER